MTKPGRLDIQPIFALITDAPTVAAPAGSHIYTGDVMYPDGRVSATRIGPNVSNVWPAPLFVRPMPVGTAIFGLRVNDTDEYWYGQETAHFGPCSGSALGVSVSPLVRMWQQSSADERKWLAQQFAEALK